MGVTVLHLLAQQVHEPDEVSVRITVNGDRVVVDDLRGTVTQDTVTQGTVDTVTTAGAEGIARMLAPLRLSAESAAEGTPVSGPVDFPALLGIEDPAALDVPALWAPRGERDFLRVPVGLTDRHEPVLLDLKESSQLGMGPHGLCVGATGSGKSELLRTLVLALATTHSPDDLALVLVDYKGGATFAPFARLPHVAGVITNLENQAGLVERVHSSLAGEVKRRQQVLKDAGDVADIGHYATLRATSRPDLEPLPHLFVVIDEFGELITAKPDFIDLFLSIGRIGRSIGVHLLLSSQRIEGGKLKGLDTYLSYRLGLRTFSADESRTVLDTTDAFHLPPLPGFGYLKVDTSTYERFKAGYVSGVYRGPTVREEHADEPLARPYPAYNTPEEPEQNDEPVVTKRETGPTVLSVMVGQLADAAAPVRRIWLPPLPDATTLDRAAGPLRAGPQGLRLADEDGPLRVPSAPSTTRPASGSGPGCWTSPSRAVTRRSSADRSPARPPCCAPSPFPWRSPTRRTTSPCTASIWSGEVCLPCPGCRTSVASRAEPTTSGPPARSPRCARCWSGGRNCSASTASTPWTGCGNCAARVGLPTWAPPTSYSSSTDSAPCGTSSPTWRTR